MLLCEIRRLYMGLLQKVLLVLWIECFPLLLLHMLQNNLQVSSHSNGNPLKIHFDLHLRKIPSIILYSIFFGDTWFEVFSSYLGILEHYNFLQWCQPQDILRLHVELQLFLCGFWSTFLLHKTWSIRLASNHATHNELRKNCVLKKLVLFMNWNLNFHGINLIPAFRFYSKFRYLLGHSLSLHSRISVGCPSQVPPFFSSTSFSLVFVLVPTPHSAEHSPKTHSSHSQWIAEIRMMWLKNGIFFSSINVWEGGSTLLTWTCIAWTRTFCLDIWRATVRPLVNFGTPSC